MKTIFSTRSFVAAWFVFFVLFAPLNAALAATGSITKRDNPLGWPNIPDTGTVTRSISISASDVPAGAQITSVNFKCLIDHPFWADIKFQYGISNRSVSWTMPSGSGQTLVSKTEYSEFDGQNPAQTWTLYLTDQYSQDTGEYDYWEITINYSYTPPQPDLVAYNVSVSDTTVNPGQSVTVNWTARNSGTGSAGSTYQGVMWSTNSYISKSDTLLDKEYLGGMSVNETSPEANAVTIPADAAPGDTYYIGVYADYDSDESESDETNGSSAVAVTVNYPDLIAYNASVSDTSVDPGQSVTVYWTAKNQGNGSAGSTYQGVMWSTNSSITSGDTLLEKEYLGSMGVNATSPESHTITIPASATPGQTYYLGAYADYDDDENEAAREGNNGSNGVAVTINYPDLVAYSAYVSDTTVDAGQSVTVYWTAKNQGTGSAGSTDQGVMWSSNSSIDRSDTLLEKEYLGSMGVNATTPEAHAITIPAAATPGQTYYLGAYADYDREENEGSYEGNNGSNGVAVTINYPPEPDLIAYSVSAGDVSVDPGQSVSISWTAKNQGTGGAGATNQGIMWSSDSSISRGDALLEKEYLGPMGVNGTSPETHTITVPANANYGQTYYIGVYADYDLDEDEGSNESNNGSSAVALTVNYPPEVISQPNPPSGAANGYVGQQLSYSGSGSTSNLGHAVEYRFDWGDGSYSSWGSASRTKTYTASGSFDLRVQARCQLHTSKISSWSNTLTVLIASPAVTIADAGIKVGSWVDKDADGYASALTLQWDASVDFGTLSLYANVRADSWNRLERDLGNTGTQNVGTTPTRFEFAVPVDLKDLDHTTWDFQIDLYDSAANTRVARLSMGSDPDLDDVHIELLSEDSEPGIISAVWLPPLEVSTNDPVGMHAEVVNIPVDTQCVFTIVEDDIIDNDERDPPYPTGNVRVDGEGRFFVQAVWDAQWEDDGLLNPWNEDPEYFFKVECLNVDQSSSGSKARELIVRNDRQQPSQEHGDFYHSDGAATAASTPLTDSRIPIILVHGQNGDKKIDSLNYWYEWCNDSSGLFNQPMFNDKYKVYRYVYDSSKPIGTNGAEFAQFVNDYYASHPEIQGRQVVVMAHSMGGLVSRFALNSNASFRDKVHRLVTLGTPHLGSPGANPTWVRHAYPNVPEAVDWFPELPLPSLGSFIATIYELYMHDGSAGFFDLAWYNINDMPDEARSTPTLFTYYQLYDTDLLDNSLTTPFTNSAEMQETIADEKIIAFGGSFFWLINGNSENWPVTAGEEVDGDHSGLLKARNLMYPMQKENGLIVGSNDGLVPVKSALLDNGHYGVDKINLTDVHGEAVDHSSYLDVPSTLDFVKERLNTMLSVTITPQEAAEAGARWRIAGGEWQKSGISLNALGTGQYSVEFNQVDGWEAPASQTVDVYPSSLTTANAAYIEGIVPVVSPMADVSVLDNNSYNAVATLVEGSEPVSWSLTQAPAGMTIDENSGTISWYSTTAGSPFTVTVRAENAYGFDEQSFLLSVEVATVAPTISDIPDQNIYEGNAFSYIASLQQGTLPVVWSLTAAPAGMNIDSGTGRVSWTASLAGSPHSVTVRAANGAGHDDEEFLIHVQSNVVAPVIYPVSDQTIEDGDFYLFSAGLQQGSLPVAWSLLTGPSGMSIDGSTGQVSWTASSTNSPYIVSVRATNGGGFDDETWTLNVNPPVCDFQLSSTSGSISADGGEVTVALSSSSQNCRWNVVEGYDWIDAAPSQGVGDTSITLTVGAHDGITDRSASIDIAGENFNIIQTGVECTFTVTPDGPANVDAEGEELSYSVLANNEACSWTAFADRNWISATPGGATGSSSVTVSIEANPTIDQRSGTITLAEHEILLTQLGVPCSYTLTPSTMTHSVEADSASFRVTAPDGCNWTVTENCEWATLLSGFSGSGNGEVNYQINHNNGEDTPRRSTIIDVSGSKFRLHQNGTKVVNLAWLPLLTQTLTVDRVGDGIETQMSENDDCGGRKSLNSTGATDVCDEADANCESSVDDTCANNGSAVDGGEPAIDESDQGAQ